MYSAKEELMREYFIRGEKLKPKPNFLLDFYEIPGPT
jgi:hypothetical protein